jgi:hypothetical protein
VAGADQGPAFAFAAQRVARLRNELHVTANRVARFRFEARPTVDVVRIPPTTAAGAPLAPRVALYRLGLTVDRLVGLIGRLPADDWERVARVGDRQMTLGAIVDEALQMGFELLGPEGPPETPPNRAPSDTTGEPAVRMGQDRRRELSGLPDAAKQVRRKTGHGHHDSATNLRSPMPSRVEPPGCEGAAGCAGPGPRQREVVARIEPCVSEHGSSTSWE